MTAKNEELLQALRRLRVETGSLVCMGCGKEHNCGIHGCAIIREAADLIENQWREIDALAQTNRALDARREGMAIGNYVVVRDDPNQKAEVSRAKQLLAQQAGDAVEQAMREHDLYIKKDGAIGWEVEVYGQRGE